MKIAIPVEDRFADWRNDSPEELRKFAAFWEGALQNELVGDFDWSFVEDLPIVRIRDSITDDPSVWATWMKGEISMCAADGDPDRYTNMFDRDIDEPVVVHIDHDGNAWIWDGCHRVGASAMRGMTTIHAVVGVRRKQIEKQELATPAPRT